jgi:hypothetical protein
LSYAIAAVVVIVVLAVVLVFANYEANHPVPGGGTYVLQYGSSPHWQDSVTGPNQAGVNVSVNWFASSSSGSGSLVIEEGSKIMFNQSISNSSGSFQSVGGPMTISAYGLLYPTTTIQVTINWVAAPGWPPV